MVALRTMARDTTSTNTPKVTSRRSISLLSSHRDKRRGVSLVMILGLSVGLALGCSAETESHRSQIDEASNQRPNLLLILADDLGFSDLGAYGGEIRTPVIDQLAVEGTLFTNFHVAAICAPTRAMLLTGADHHTAGLGTLDIVRPAELEGVPGYEGHLSDRVVTIATRLKEAGYRTYLSGKWHLGVDEGQLPADRGFDRSLALSGASGDNYERKSHAAYDHDPLFFDGHEPFEPGPEFFSSNAYTDRLIDNLKEDRNSEEPFFAYLSFQAVHYPHQAPLEYIERYAETYSEGWEVLRRTRYERLVQLGLFPGGRPLLPHRAIEEWEALSEEEQRYRARQMAVYAAMVEQMDTSIGRVLEHLRAAGEYDDTVIVFLSDNGADNNQQRRNFPEFFEEGFDLSFENLGLPGSHSSYGPGWAAASSSPLSNFKGSSAEGGMRVPLIVSYPKAFQQGEVSDALSWVIDLPATLLELAGADLGAFPEHAAVKGRSLAAHLRGESARVYSATEAISYEFVGNAAVFRDRYKARRLHAPFGDGSWELFDLAADPTESDDLADERPGVLEELRQDYEQYETRVGVAPLPEGYNPVREIVARGRRRLAATE